ncbi:uncharacterized protein SEPMUDRAFT_111426 [Sphaerulina musiva SO2202]|uniref:MAPEG-domain-containing protein n=1 Tax=Sphaerulina musiva (strain SO2202) TaxID=692275 RepID=M3BS83_SPHMS|nr:uncharacterized protein SEPMUDRAFT_111426 [Sphaerulina musiva SO2202]EMF08943.1 hypothetical protein SEPMUDRAFT_111426 [Sphaerulina musiva SO2202]
MSNNRKDFPSADEVKAKSKQGKDTLVAKLREDGVENPSGLLLTGFSALFLAAIPLTSYITQPNSIFEKSLNGLTSTLTHLIPSSSPTSSSTNKIATLATLYLTVTYALSGAASAAGINSAYAEGRDNNYPRKQVVGLKEGLPLRLYSAHYHLMEMFPGWAVVAALAQGIAPHDQGVVNLLGLHVVAKCFVHYPAYILNWGNLRSLAHVVATASVLNVALRLAKRPLM